MNIAKGKIGNALTSTADNHVVAVAADLYDEELGLYQDEINKRLADKTVGVEGLVSSLPEASSENEGKVYGIVYDNLITGLYVCEEDSGSYAFNPLGLSEASLYYIATEYKDSLVTYPVGLYKFNGEKIVPIGYKETYLDGGKAVSDYQKIVDSAVGSSDIADEKCMIVNCGGAFGI